MKFFSILLAGVMITGCAFFNAGKTDKVTNYVAAPEYQSPEPIVIPGPPKVAPGPGQYIPIEKFEPEQKSALPSQAIQKASTKSTEKATDEKFVNAITVYEYQEGLIYQIYCAPGQVTDIIFDPGEAFTVEDIGAGDTNRWGMKLSASGQGPARRLHLFLRPKTSGLKTNMVIPTNRRIYHVELKSYKSTYQTAVRWNYPLDEYNKKVAAIYEDYDQDSGRIPDVRLEDANFNYTVVGNARFRPVRVFDDGAKTYIAFPEDIDRQSLPPLFIVSRDNSTALVNYRYHAKYYIVDTIFETAVLKLGEARPQEVYIYNKNSELHKGTTFTQKRIVHVK